MKKNLTRSAALALGLLLAASSGRAADTGQNRKISCTSLRDVPIGTVFHANAAHTDITHALRGYVLTVDAMVTGSASTPYMLVTSQAGLLEPAPAPATHCEAGEPCTLTAHLWRDLDIAEQENPGGVIGSPIRTEILVFDADPTEPAPHVNITLCTQLVKKS